MADGRGGYRRPNKPASVSGPGAMSRRTDGGPAQPIRELPNAEYGEGKAFRELQQAQSLPSGPQLPSPPVSLPDVPVVPMNAPSSRPNEPVTAGANAGPGPGMDALGLPDQMSQELSFLRARLPALEILANMPNSSLAVRSYVRRLRGMAAD